MRPLKRTRKGCSGKVRYSNPLYAFQAFVQLATNGEWHRGLDVYPCSVCGGFHIGHHRLTKRTRTHFGKLLSRTPLAKFLVRLSE